ncbi:MAG TPA: HIT family protein [Candidatus Saccharimonadales bacterium]
MSDTIFDKLIAKQIPSWIVWEDDSYLAFLTPFPNTDGMCVVIPKTNVGDYLFDIREQQMLGLISASKKVAKLLEKALGVKRVAMVVEGTGVAYVHVKLYPLHGKLASQTDVWSTHAEFYPQYVGYLTTVEGPKMDDQKLDEIQAKILEANK